MNSSQKLETFLSEIGGRLSRRVWAIGIAIVASVATIATLAAIPLFLRNGFDAELVSYTRAGIFVLLLSLAGIAIYLPLKRLTRSATVKYLERRVPSLDGRAQTWSESESNDSPMAQLLAADAMENSKSHSSLSLVPPWHLRAPSGLAAIAFAGLIAILTIASENWRYGAQHLWLGWIFDDRLPPQSLIVEPGDTTIKRGSNVVVSVTSHGFNPEQATLHALLDNSWQEVAMRPVVSSAQYSTIEQGTEFQFTLFGVTNPVEYFVSSVGINSPRHIIDIIEMANVENIQIDYNYPVWTGLEAKSESPATRIRAVADTTVTLTFQTDRPMNRPEVVINGEAHQLDADGNTGTSQFTLAQSGEYFLVDFLGDEAIRISDTYPIIIVEDARPSIQVVYPGRDWDATNIEEVPLQFEAEDDFALESVRLHFSVNGGDWQSRDLELTEAGVTIEELLFLEEIRYQEETDPVLQPITRNNDSPTVLFNEPEESEPQPLMPGDVIAYYAEALDREMSAQTDILFIDIQPFERRFSQSQQGGGGAGGAGGTGGDNEELAERQREIVVATWNLVRAENGQQSSPAPIDVEDNAKMLSTLQSTLEEQTRTLAERARARQLDSSDPLIAEFVENLDKAAASMTPASDLLNDIALNESLQPQQKALQHLMRADALFQDINVSMQQDAGGGGGGGGGGAASDLAEIYELEMDLEQNQYETRNPINMDPTPEEAVDQSIDQLKELAQRQQQLADSAQRDDQLSLAERWQQQQLQRELEELQEQLEQLQQQNTQSGGQQQGQGQSASGQALQDAVDALNEATQQSQANANPEDLRQAMEEAQRQINNAIDELNRERQQQISENYADLTNRAEDLFDQQEQVSAELQEALRQSIEDRENGDEFSSGLSLDEEDRLADIKRSMAEELTEIEQRMEATAERSAETMPESSEALRQAMEDLEDQGTVSQLNEAALEIEYGYAPFTAVREVLTTTALNNLRFSLQQAEQLAQSESVDSSGTQTAENRELSAEEQVRQMRLALADAIENESAQGGENGGQAGGANGQFGDRAGGGNFDGVGGFGGEGIRDQTIDGDALAEWTMPTEFADQPIDGEVLDMLPSEILSMSADLLDSGVDAMDITELQRMARDLANQNPERLDALLSEQYLEMLSLLEKMELALTDDGRSSAIQALSTDRENLGDEKEIADYFRGLSDQPLETAN